MRNKIDSETLKDLSVEMLNLLERAASRGSGMPLDHDTLGDIDLFLENWRDDLSPNAKVKTAKKKVKA